MPTRLARSPQPGFRSLQGLTASKVKKLASLSPPPILASATLAAAAFAAAAYEVSEIG